MGLKQWQRFGNMPTFAGWQQSENKNIEHDKQSDKTIFYFYFFKLVSDKIIKYVHRLLSNEYQYEYNKL